ncbi:MAG TPA: UDP-N-acetylmuramoyl-tripeptide--D-alanyl-D-alanine ligase [Nocardioidaceae bacterium]|nr:UDP-N-acetylmuramoyl-tripeptide--D-alanyl-D-alanine ligase [Nocardioidaceae bacterium]
MTLDEIASAIGGRVHATYAAGAVDAARIRVTGPPFHDSRAVEVDGLFVAVAGEHVDGHDFAAAVVDAGAAAVLAARPVDVPAVLVDDPVEALGRLATHVLAGLPDLRVVGLTGSQGKTGTKDLLAQLLENTGATIAPVGSYNTELGVPLTALRADRETRNLVLEMGARGIGHIRYLADMVRPSVAVVLNVGVAHLGEFGSQAGIARAKGELVEALPDDGVAVLNADDPLVMAMAERTRATVLTFGTSSQADVRVGDLELDDLGRPRFTLTTPTGSAAVTLPLVGEHQALNAAAAAAVAHHVGLPVERICQVLHNVVARSPWRMEVRDRDDGVTVVNDAYNANPDSMRAALKTLATIGAGRRRTVAVLGEMLELGAAAREEHDAIGRLAVRLDVSRLVVVGEGARAIHLGASLEGSWGGESVFVPDTDAALDLLRGEVAAGDVVLVKASRAAGLERVAAALLDPGSRP